LLLCFKPKNGFKATPIPLVFLGFSIVATTLSFISQLIKDKKAKFSVSLFYKDNAERQNFVCKDFDYNDEANEIIAKQEISIDFRYAPAITPNTSFGLSITPFFNSSKTF
jgi:hypothetical protein